MSAYKTISDFASESPRTASMFAAGLIAALHGLILFFSSASWRLASLSFFLGAYVLLLGYLNLREENAGRDLSSLSSLVSGGVKFDRRAFIGVSTKTLFLLIALAFFLALLSDPYNMTNTLVVFLACAVAVVFGQVLQARKKKK